MEVAQRTVRRSSTARVRTSLRTASQLSRIVRSQGQRDSNSAPRAVSRQLRTPRRRTSFSARARCGTCGVCSLTLRAARRDADALAHAVARHRSIVHAASIPISTRFAAWPTGVQLVPVYRRLLGDALTPVSAFHKIDAGRTRLLVRERRSAARRSAATASWPPIRSCRSTPAATRVTIVAAAGREELRVATIRWTSFAAASRRFARPTLPELPPFTGGASATPATTWSATARTLPNAPPDDRQLPDLAFAFYDQMVVFDNVEQDDDRRGDGPARQQGDDLAAAYDDACRRVDELVDQLSTPPADSAAGRHRHRRRSARSRISSNFTQAEFEAAVGKCVEYIRAGDIFQVVISQRLQAGDSAAIRSRSTARCGW